MTAAASTPAPAGTVASAAVLPPAVDAATLRGLGRLAFHDPSLSGSGRLACSSCHDPAHAYAPANTLAVQWGGAHLDRQGPRAVPSLRYVLNHTPHWSEPYVANLAERLLEGQEPPAGGFGWDGRFNSLRDQAVFPLLSADEMANAGAADVVAKLRQAAYADRFRRAFGAGVFNDTATAFAALLAAIERFELDDPGFHPFTSRYDAYLDGRLKLTAQELRGRQLFDDPGRGNCASCHPDRKGADGSHPLFTDYQFEALGVPRNPEIRANADPAHYDLGLCGPLRTDQSSRTRFCGLFKTPTLRNVATRGALFHNGRFHDLKQALQFYVSRDTDAARWYPVVNGRVNQYDDLPPRLRGNVDVTDEPLTRHPGEPPAWTDAQIDDVVAFLETLTDADARGPVR